MGPLAQKFIEDMCECSKTHCGGHGRCMPRLVGIIYALILPIQLPACIIMVLRFVISALMHINNSENWSRILACTRVTIKLKLRVHCYPCTRD